MTTFTINQKPAVTSVDPTADVFPVWQGAAQKKATAAQIVASVPMVGDTGSGGTAGIVPAPASGDAAAGKFLRADATWTPAAGLLAANTTIDVAASGGDFTTVQAALDSLNEYQISPRARIDIGVAPGTYTHAAPIIKDGPFGQYTFIKGTVYTRNLTSVQSSSGSAGAWSIVLNMDSVANIATNDYIGFVSPTGGTLPSYLAGCHKVANVDAVNTRITITSTHRAATAPSGAVTCAGTVFKSILSFTDVDGIRIWSGGSTLNLEDICVVGTNYANTNGLSVQDGGGRLYIAGTVGVVGFNVGVYAVYNTECNGDGTIIISSASTYGVIMDAGSYFSAWHTTASGCGEAGFSATSGGVIVATDGVSTGHGHDGVIAQNTATVNLDRMTVTGNGRWGVNVDGTSQIGLINTPIMSGNYRENHSFRQFVSVDGNAMFGDISYGYNGTVTPDGHNTFLGWGAGTTNCGSTATATNESSANVGIGQYATNSLTKGYMNVGVGYGAMSYITTGYNNVGIGQRAGQKATGGSTNNVTSYDSVYIGAQTKAKADGGANEIVIGSSATGNGSNTTTIGNASTTLTQLAGAVNSTAYTVATLPSAATSGAGARAFVTDANATMTAGIGTTVVGGSTNKVPVYSDGTNWIIG